jgi:hypothetical protein BACCOPRO_01084
LGTKGVKGEKITWEKIYAALGMGGVLFFLNGWLLRLPLPFTIDIGLYIITISAGYACLLMAGLWMSRLLKPQPDGRCVQQREREFYAGNAVSGE